MSPFLRIATKVTHDVGKILIRHSKRTDQIIMWEESGQTICNSSVECEEEIINQFSHFYPEHSISSKNKKINKKEALYHWIIDPLEGIRNFSAGIPYFAITICLKYKNETQLGIVYDPLRDELFSAEKNEGSTLNRIRIRVKENQDLADAIITTYLSNQTADREYFIKYSNHLIQASADIRQTGVPSIDICYVACGRYSAFWGMPSNCLNDATNLILKEAGGIIHDGTHDDILVSNSQLVDTLKKDWMV